MDLTFDENGKHIVEDADIQHLQNKLNNADEVDRERLQRQIDTLKDAIIVYRLSCQLLKGKDSTILS